MNSERFPLGHTPQKGRTWQSFMPRYERDSNLLPSIYIQNINQIIMNKISLFSLRDSLQATLFNFRERLIGYRRERTIFKQLKGYDLNLKNPLSFSEKVIWKKLYDRNPFLPVVADKYMVRQYLKDVLGEEGAEKILIPLLYVTDKPETIPFDTLPEEYILKANHGSRTNIIVDKNSPADREKIIAQCRRWLSQPYGLKMHEWAYQRINRKIVIEKLLRDENGKVPTDYKFYVFHGKCYLISVIYDRFSDIRTGWYSPQWEHLNIRGQFRQAECVAKPEQLNSMIGLAELLGSNFDFIRADLYVINSKIYFGELTSYPGSGRITFTPMSFDFELGEKWKIVPKYWKQVNYCSGA